MRRLLPDSLAIYLVADPDQTARDLLDVVDQGLDGGVTAVQLRAKSQTDRALLELARAVNARCRDAHALFLVNDRVDIALACGADGVHLGVDDLPLEDARRLLGPGAVIGYSPETDRQAGSAAALGADYLGVGPVFGTVSKSDAGAAIGPAALTRRVALSGIPTIGIGGITPENAGEVIAAGAVGVAVVGAILRADDPKSASARLAESVRAAVDRR